MALGEDEMKALAADGPIITFHVSRFRSDAIIVTAEPINLVPLPELKYRDLEANVKLFIAAGTSVRRNARNAKLGQRKSDNEQVERVLL